MKTLKLGESKLAKLMQKHFGSEEAVRRFYNVIQEDASINGVKEWLQEHRLQYNSDTVILKLIEELEQ